MKKLNKNYAKKFSINERPVGIYQLSKNTYYAILNTRNEHEKRKRPKDYVLEVINNNFGLIPYIIDLSIVD